MTNYEKYKEQIDWQARAGGRLAVRKSDNTPTMCEGSPCNKCKFNQSGTKSCRLQAIEWLKAECVEPKKEIEVGDKVEVIDEGYNYSTYVDWIISHILNKYDMLSYDFGHSPSNGDIGVVRSVGLHLTEGIMLYYIKLESTGRCYLISKDGIKLYRKKKANENDNRNS